MLSFLVCLPSCGDDEPKKPSLSVSGSIAVEANGTANGEILVTAENTDWSVDVTSGNDWLQAFKNGNKINVIAKENIGTASRNGILTVTATEDASLTRTIMIVQAGLNETLSVSPTSVSLLADEGSATSITITTNVEWQITNVSDWLHLSATSGNGTTQVTLTSKSENFSDEPRSAKIIISTQNKSSEITINQEPLLAQGCRVNISNPTIMCDGFACDLSFGREARGYKEGFFTTSAVQTLTERDIYNMLMQKDEYAALANWTVSPIVNPSTTIVYCIAAYGNENKADGTHKYGPMTMKTITTTAKTLYADMYVTADYTSSSWIGAAQKVGAYGTRCQKYYYFGFTGEDAEEAKLYFEYAPYAYLAHFVYKPIIAAYPNDYAISDQPFIFERKSGEKQFFFGTWGIDDNGNYSSEHTAAYINLSSSGVKQDLINKKSKAARPSEWNSPRHIPTATEVEKLRRSVKIIKVK